MAGLRHATAISGPNNPLYQVSKNVWNSDHLRGLPVFNVKTDYGAVGDGVTNDTTAIQSAIDAAAAISGGVVLLPDSAIYRVTTLVLAQGVHGVVIAGSAMGGAGIGGPSVLQGPNAASPVVINVNGTSSGGVSGIQIRDLFISYDGSSSNTTGIRIWNCLDFHLQNVIILANGIPLTIQGSGRGTALGVQAYIQQSPSAANAAVMIGNGAGALTSPGPLHWVGGIIQGGGSNGTPALRIADSGSAVSSSFVGTMFAKPGGGTGTHVVHVDGSTTSVAFVDCYAESTYNTANNGATFILGSTSKAGSVRISGGDFWGHGDSVNYQQDFVRVVDCKQLIVEGVRTDRLAAANGFSRAMIRFESTALDSGDFAMCIANDKGNINGTTYSDGGSGRGINTASNGAFFFGTDTIDTLPNLQSGIATRSAGDLTTASTIYVDATGVTVSLTLGTMTSGKVMVSVSGSSFNSVGTTYHKYQIVADSTVAKQVIHEAVQASTEHIIDFSVMVTGLAAGAHTFKLQWAVGANTGTLRGGTVADLHTSIMAVEV